MRIITGDECGLLKETIPELSRPSDDGNNKLTSPASDEGVSRIEVNNMNGDEDDQQQLQQQQYRQSRSRGIVGLAFLPQPSNDDDGDDDDENDNEEEEEKFNTNKKFQFAALRVDGSVESWEGRVNGATKTFTKKNKIRWSSRNAGQYYQHNVISSNVFATPDIGEDNDENQMEKKEKKKSETFTASRPIKIVSPYKSSSLTTSTPPILACCDSWGRLSILNTTNNILAKDGENDGIVARYNAFGTNNDDAKVSILKGNAPNVDVATACVIDSAGCRIAVGGRERETVLLDVETGKFLWKGKNLPPDPQTLLQHPIWSTSIQFLTSSSSDEQSKDSNLLAVGTAYKQVRLYDVRESTTRRRPIAYTPTEEGCVLGHRITALCQTAEHQLCVGDSAGYIHSLDIRYMLNNPTPSKRKDDKRGFLGRYNGPCGSIRQIVKHESLNIMSCVGLDRMLRTYDIASRKMLDCVYLKQRLNCMLFCEDGLVSQIEEKNKNEIAHGGSGDGIDNNGEIVGGDINQDDDVQDYVDSDEEDKEDEEVETEEESPADEMKEGEEEGSSDGSEESDSDEDDQSSDDGSDEDPDEDNDDDEESDDDPEPSPKPKKRLRRSYK